MTERRACRVVGQPRSTQRLVPPVPSDDDLALASDGFLRVYVDLSRLSRVGSFLRCPATLWYLHDVSLARARRAGRE